MSAGVEVGTAWVNLAISGRGAADAIAKEIMGAEPGAQQSGDRAGNRFGSGLVAAAKRWVLPLAGAFAGAKVGQGLKDSVTEASGLNESMNAIKVTFGDAEGAVRSMGETAARSMGLSNLEFNNLAVRFSAFSKTIAGDGGNVAEALGSITGRAADFASVMNLEVSEAAELFQSGLAGETEPLRRFGIDLSAASVEAFAYANGIAEAGTELTEAQKVQARYGSLMAQTAATQGDFTNTSGELANQQRIAASLWSNISARIGGMFLPTLSNAMGFITTTALPAIEGLMGKADAMSARFEAAGGVSGGLARAKETLAGLVQGFRDFAGADLGTVAGHWDTITAAAPGLLDALTRIGTTLLTAFGDVSEKIGITSWGLFVQVAGIVASVVQSVVLPALTWLAGWLERNPGLVQAVIGGIILWRLAVNTLTFARLLIGLAQTTAALARNAAAWLANAGRVAASIASTMALHAMYAADAVRNMARATAATVAGLARQAAAWAVSAAQSIAHAARMGAAVVASVAMQVAQWAILGVQSMIGAVKVAAAWVVAMGPVGWVIAAVVGLVALIIANWDTVVAWTKAAWENVSGWLAGAWENIKTTATNAWNGLVEWVKSIPGRLWDAFLNFTLIGLLIQHWDTIRAGAQTAWDTVVNWVKGIPGKLWNAFLNFTLIGLLIQHWDTIKAGAEEKWTALVEWIRGVPGRITSALGNLGSLLVTAGRNIISGLLEGITEKFNDVKDFVTGIGTWIADHKGPKAYDLALLVPAGRWIMTGLRSGLRSQVPGLEEDLRAVSRTVQAGITGKIGVGTAGRPAPGTGVGGGGVAFYGNVGWDAETVARKIEERTADRAAVENLRGVLA